MDASSDPSGARVKNVIDLLVNRGGLTFQDAIARLSEDWKNPPQNEYEIPRRKAIFQQLSVINADKYRITVQNTDSTIAELGGQEFFTKFEILENNRILYQKNKEGRNIYVTPQETDEIIYLLVDDVKVSKISSAGYFPNLLQQTSQNSFQAIFILEREFQDRKVYIELFNKMNREFGDKGINGLRHAFRLAGYQHAQKNGFVTKVLETRKEHCQKMLQTARQVAQSPDAFGAIHAQDGTGHFQACEISPRLRKFATGYQSWIVRTYGQDLDKSRGDFMLAARLRQIGTGENEIYTVLMEMPLQQNPNPERYAWRTTVNSRPAAAPAASTDAEAFAPEMV